MSKDLLHRRMMMQAGGGGGLPSEYQQVEYITLSGAQYTTITFPRDVDLYNSIINITFSATYGRYNAILATSDIAYWLWSGNTSYFQFGYGWNNFTRTNLGNFNKIKIDATLTSANPSFSSLYIMNGTSYSKSAEVSRSAISKSSIYVGKGSSYYLIGNIYYLKIEDNNGDIVEVLPCYRKADNVAGLYDIINGIFYTNEGTGTFIVGAEV